MNDDLTYLYEIAKAATPYNQWPCDEHGCMVVEKEADQLFVSQFTPDVVMGLIDEVKRLRVAVTSGG